VIIEVRGNLQSLGEGITSTAFYYSSIGIKKLMEYLEAKA
jgi:hypothetical protein